MTERLRWLPAVHECLDDPPAGVGGAAAGGALARAALDIALARVRSMLLDGGRAGSLDSPESVRRAVDGAWEEALADLLSPSILDRVVNATGVVLHTNLGRAPLAEKACAAAAEAGGGYVPLEYDLESGERGSRYLHAVPLLKILTGAEDALVVNNNAAALLLAVDTLAGGRGVVVSRGELVEIGGGFRVHEILARGSARIVEVGSTNKTHPADYERAFAEHDVGAILKVHRSNFRMTGFTGGVALEDLCRLADRMEAPVVFDQGTGLLVPHPAAPDEPTLADAVRAGAAIACGSGDKLLGGPQAGMIVGRRAWLDRLRENPLLRALRVDKMTLAALAATLELTLRDPSAVPVRRMLGVDAESLESRAAEVLGRLSPASREQCAVRPHGGRAGAGTLPGRELAGHALVVTPAAMSAGTLAARLRAGRPPIIARTVEDVVWIDFRTITGAEADAVRRRLEEVLAERKNER